jgi:hypothetical protein
MAYDVSVTPTMQLTTLIPLSVIVIALLGGSFAIFANSPKLLPNGRRIPGLKASSTVGPHYDLWELRAKGLVEKIPHSRRYRLKITALDSRYAAVIQALGDLVDTVIQSGSKLPRKGTHYENRILVWGPIMELKGG